MAIQRTDTFKTAVEGIIKILGTPDRYDSLHDTVSLKKKIHNLATSKDLSCEIAVIFF